MYVIRDGIKKADVIMAMDAAVFDLAHMFS